MTWFAIASLAVGVALLAFAMRREHDEDDRSFAITILALMAGLIFLVGGLIGLAAIGFVAM